MDLLSTSRIVVLNWQGDKNVDWRHKRIVLGKQDPWICAKLSETNSSGIPHRWFRLSREGNRKARLTRVATCSPMVRSLTVILWTCCARTDWSKVSVLLYNVFSEVTLVQSSERWLRCVLAEVRDAGLAAWNHLLFVGPLVDIVTITVPLVNIIHTCCPSGGYCSHSVSLWWILLALNVPLVDIVDIKYQVCG